jgi:hypothetical protein
MMDHFIGRHIRRTNRNLLVANAVLIVVVVVAAAVSSRYLYNFALGPFPVDADALVGMQSPDQALQYYVTVKGERLIDIGSKQIERRVDKATGKVRSESVKAVFLVLVMPQRLLLVKAPGSATDPQVTGKLVSLPEDVRGRILGPLENQVPDARGRFLPAMLDSTGFYVPGLLGLAIGVPCLLLGLWNVKKALRRRANPLTHPLAVKLQPLGEPEQVIEAIDREVEDMEHRQTIGSTILTTSWLVRPQTFGLGIIHLGDMLWAYQKVTKHSVNFVPTGKSFTAILCARRGQTVEIGGSEQATKQLLEAVWQRVPWMLVGFDARLAALRKKNPAGLEEIVAERRRQFNAAVDEAAKRQASSTTDLGKG